MILEKLNSFFSSKWLAITCIPNGIPLLWLPNGIEIAGLPDKFACTVKMSCKYIAIGSFTPPRSNAVVGVVGSIDPLYASYDVNNHPINDPWPTPFSSGGFDIDASGVLHQNPLSISEYKEELVFPNPISVSGTLHIKSKHTVASIKLFDNLGKSYVFKNSSSLNLAELNLSTGVYVLQYEILGQTMHKKISVNQWNI